MSVPVTWDDLASYCKAMERAWAAPRLSLIKVNIETWRNLDAGKLVPAAFAQSIYSVPVHIDNEIPIGAARYFDQYGGEMKLDERAG